MLPPPSPSSPPCLLPFDNMIISLAGGWYDDDNANGQAPVNRRGLPGNGKGTQLLLVVRGKRNAHGQGLVDVVSAGVAIGYALGQDRKIKFEKVNLRASEIRSLKVSQPPCATACLELRC